MIRSLLFLPGNSPNMLINGDILGADGIILDLEDAVAPDEKDAARILVRNAMKYLNYSQTTVVIRINAIDETGLWMRDLDQVIPCAPQMILLPKAGSKEDVKAASEYIGDVEEKHGVCRGSVKIIPLIETAAGIENAYGIALSDERVTALFLGAEDLTADLRCERTKEGKEIFYARSRIVTAARAASIEPIDTPFTDVNDIEGIYEEARLAKALGFSCKAAISPRHITAINQVFSPTKEEVQYASLVLETIKQAEAEGKGAVSLYGKMIDKPIVQRAKQVIAAAKQLNMNIDEESCHMEKFCDSGRVCQKAKGGQV